MRRAWPWVVAMLSALVPLVWRSRSTHLLQDTDTAFLLRAIRQAEDPLRWFVGDWPLANHFYRPISTLTFELDDRMYGNNPAGYAFTNALLAATCVLALFWMVRTIFRSDGLAAGAAGLFALWQAPWAGVVLTPLGWMAPWGAALTVVLARRNEPLARVAAPTCMAWLAGAYLGKELVGVAPLYARMIDWVPGRTASTMAVFALLSVGSFAQAEGTRRPLPWLLASLVAACLALGSYEQAVMLPGVLLGAFLLMRWQDRKPASWPVGAAFALLALYLVFRHAVLPGGPSGYQEQQFRSGPGVVLAIADYVAPGANAWPIFGSLLGMGAEALLIPSLYTAVTLLAANAAGWRAAWLGPGRLPALGGWALSSLAFLPMAWLKPFDHYHYWPMALRALLVVGLVQALARLGGPER